MQLQQNLPAQSSPSQPFPNLGNVITTDDVSQKGTGSYKADYVNWCRTMHLLHDHAPGWQFVIAEHPISNEHVFKAPNGTAYVVGFFLGPDGDRTPDFPQAIMDNRNNAIPFDKVSARDLTDSHRRCLCTAAAAQFGLAWQLWAREEIENPHRESVAAPAKPAAKIEGVEKDDQPLSEQDRNQCLLLAQELSQDGLARFCEDFRRRFDLPAGSKVATYLTSVKHQKWMNANMSKYV